MARLPNRHPLPFTFSHPAAVLPLRRFGDLSALVIGSMVPDAGYLLILELPRQLTHGCLGLIVFCLPVGLALYGFYHGLLRRPFLALLPDGVRLRLSGRTEFPATLAGGASLSACCWAASPTCCGMRCRIRRTWKRRRPG